MLPGLGGAIAASTKPAAAIRGTVQTSSQVTGASLAVTMPTHQSGDVLVVLACYRDGVAVTPSAGWTEAVQLADSASGGGTVAYYRLASGSTHTLTITNTNAREIAAHAYALTGGQGAVSATAATGADPPSHTPSWGGGGNFWIAANGTNVGNAPTAGPTGFVNSVQTDGGGGNAVMSTLNKADDSAVLDPSAFTGAGMNAAGQVSITLAVRPL